MASVYESQWQERKANVQTDINALINLGLSLETARRLAGWNETLDYDTFAEVTSLAWPPQPTPPIPSNGLKQYLKLQVSRSDSRTSPGALEGAVLDAGKPYAIFIPDVPQLLIADITFSLNGSTVHHEYSTPWDYAGTTDGGKAFRTTFVVGSYNIEAIVNATGGPYSFDASFTVE